MRTTRNHAWAVLALLALAWAFSATVTAQSRPPAICSESKTEFHDVSGFRRKNGAADNMTRRHDEYTLGGWAFVDMEVYTENGDLEGLFLTYSREVACPTPPG